MVQNDSEDSIYYAFRKKLVDHLAEAFLEDPIQLRPLLSICLPEAVNYIPWRGISSGDLSEIICEKLKKHLGRWLGLHTFCVELFKAFPKNATVKNLCHESLVLLNTYAEPGKEIFSRADYAQRMRAVRIFLDAYFSDYPIMHAIPSGEEACLESSRRYLELFSQAIDVTERKAPLQIRLDVFDYVANAMLDHGTCRVPLLHIMRALGFPGRLIQPDEILCKAMESLLLCLHRFLDAGVMPPIDNRYLLELLEFVKSGDVSIGDVAYFSIRLEAISVIDGTRWSEHKLASVIPDLIHRAEKWALFSQRIVALLEYRRCLSYIYCGEWVLLEAAIENLPESCVAWDPNWTAFLLYEIGKADESISCYQRTADGTGGEMQKSAALRGLLELLEISHSTLDGGGDYFENLNKKYARRAELEQAISGLRHQLQSAQHLHDGIQHRQFLAACSRQNHQAREALRIIKGGGLVSGAPATAPISLEYHARWLIGLPALGLCDTEVDDLLQTALLRQPLSTVLEISHLACVNNKWIPKNLRISVRTFISEHGMERWSEIIKAQRTGMESLIAVFGNRGDSPKRCATTVVTRLMSRISFFAILFEYLPLEELRRLAGACSVLLRHQMIARILGSTAHQSLCALFCRCTVLIGQTVEEFGFAPEQAANIVIPPRSFPDSAQRRYVQVWWPRLGLQYRQELVVYIEMQLKWYPEELWQMFLGEDCALAELSRILGKSVDLEAVVIPLEDLMRLVVRHWATWRAEGVALPILELEAGHVERGDLDCRLYYRDLFRPELIRAIRSGRFMQRHRPLKHAWFRHGVSLTAELAVRLSDEWGWVELFEAFRPWPLPQEGMLGDLGSLRRHLEDGADSLEMRRRFLLRMNSGGSGHERVAIVQNLCLVLRRCSVLFAEDAEILLSLSVRMRCGDLSLLHLFEVIRIVLSKFRNGNVEPGSEETLQRCVARVLVSLEHRLVGSGILSRMQSTEFEKMLEVLETLPSEMFKALNGELWGESIKRLREWNASHGY